MTKFEISSNLFSCFNDNCTHIQRNIQQPQKKSFYVSSKKTQNHMITFNNLCFISYYVYDSTK